MNEGQFRLDTGKIFFIVRVVMHWNKLPREVVLALSLKIFKTRVDGTLSNLVLVKDVPTYWRGVETAWLSKVPSNPFCFLCPLSG